MNSNKILNDTIITSDKIINETPLPKQYKAAIYDEVNGVQNDSSNIIDLVIIIILLISFILASIISIYVIYSLIKSAK
jgi:hypothetical protein